MEGDRPQLRLTRRAFLSGAAALAAGRGFGSWDRLLGAAPAIEGAIVGPAFAAGHLLREGRFPAPSRTERTGVAIVGAGVSGLSAGWKLARCGFADFVILDLEAQAGGNSRWGENAASAYPWGAHYLPFPGPQARAVSELLREIGVQTGTDGRGRPVYDERYVCHAPDERIFLHGRWQEGLFPRLGAQPEDLRQYADFTRAMAAMRRRRGADGRQAFAFPMERSSRDPELLALDRISMADYLSRNAWTSPRLRWFVEYGCRDDFGCLLSETSAWAGVHYFAARGEGEDEQVLTWPEGNGWLVRRLLERVPGKVRTGALAFDVRPAEGGARVDYLDLSSGSARRIFAKAALICVPRFTARRVVAPLRGTPPDEGFRYSSWAVANLSVAEPPAGKGAAPAWDNVLYNSGSLGYVRATHQSLAQEAGRDSVWTYYLPLLGGDPAERRREAYAAKWPAWRDRVLADLSRAHPGISRHVRRLDVMVWGHAMVKPEPGFLWGGAREAAARPIGPILFGHSDLSGFSVFEEAQHRGVAAAEAALAMLGRRFRSSL